MIGVAVVVGVSVALATVTAVTTASTRWHADPVDTAAAQRRLEDVVRRSSRRRARLRARLHRRVDRWSAGTVLLVSALAVLLAVAVVIGLLLDMIDEGGGIAEADGWVADWGADHATDASTRVIEGVTQFGARPLVLLALALAALADWRRRRNREVFAFVAVVGIGEMLLVNALKLLVARDRPDVMRLVDAGGHSFPSGHTSAAAAAWIAVALVLGRGRSRRARVALSSGAVAIAVAVATSRALLGVHWLTDVLAGLALGWGWYLVVAIAFGGRRQRLGAPLHEAAPDVVAAHPGDTEDRASDGDAEDATATSR